MDKFLAGVYIGGVVCMFVILYEPLKLLRALHDAFLWPFILEKYASYTKRMRG